MKKTVITILLILPFLLIYFISFTGRILSKYTHIYVERVVVLDEEGNEYNNNDYIQIGKDEDFELQVKVYPELSSNKQVVFSNSDKLVCTINDTTHVVTGIDYGVSKLIITSKDRHFVQFIINIRVVEEDILDIEVNKTQVEVGRGKSEKVDATILPNTVIEDNSYLVWTSMDEDIAIVSQGLITGVEVGQTIVRVSSLHKPQIFQDILVVVSLELPKGVYFDYTEINKIYEVDSVEFDLKPLIVINKLPSINISDLYFRLENISTVDASKLSDGILIFTKPKEIVSVSISVEFEGVVYVDSLDIWYSGGQ